MKRVEVDFTYSARNGAACPAGHATTTMVSLINATVGLARLMKGMSALTASLPGATAGGAGAAAASLPQSSGEMAQRLGASFPADLSMLPLSTSYRAKVRAVLTWNEEERAYVLESGEMRYTASSRSRLVRADSALVDALTGSGSVALRPDEHEVRLGFTGSADAGDLRCRLDVKLGHEVALQGETRIDLAGGVFWLREARAGDGGTITAGGLTEHGTDEAPTVSTSIGYFVERPVGDDGSIRGAETYLDVFGTHVATRWQVRGILQAVAFVEAADEDEVVEEGAASDDGEAVEAEAADESASPRGGLHRPGAAAAPPSPGPRAPARAKEIVVPRGEPVTLHAEDSVGGIREYRWTFEPLGDAPLPERNVALTGERVTVRLLASMKVTLDVFDGAQHDTASVRVIVEPRRWKPIPFRREPTILPLTAPLRVRHGSMAFGRNVCFEDGLVGQQSSNHYIHKSDLVSWETAGYTLAKIEDEGPYGGMWFVAEHHLHVHRAALVNYHLGEHGPAYELSTENVFRANARDPERARDLRDFTAAIGAHEQMHATLMEEELRRIGPDLIEDLERRVFGDHDTLKSLVDLRIEEAEDALGEATAEDRLKKRLLALPGASAWDRPGMILLPHEDTGKYVPYQIPNIALHGD